MPFSFDIPTYAQNGLPPNKRLPKWILFIQSLLYPLTWRWGVFVGYRDGDPQPAYVSGTTYGYGDKVKYNFKTYDSIAPANTGNQPDISPFWWVLRNNSIIGASERAMYTGRLMTLTWALNRQFGTVWRNLPWPAPYDFGVSGGVFPDIYITNAPIAFTSFVMYPTSAPTSKMYPHYSTGFMFAPPIYGSSSSYAFIVWIPIAVWTALGATTAIRNSIVNAYVALYAPCGITWTISTY